MQQLNWTCKRFDALTVAELYAILQLRNAVFSVEQHCIYQDADDKDQPAYHLCGWDGTILAAYCRLLPSGISYTHTSIGRVVTAPEYRKGGYGREMMQLAVQKTVALFHDDVIIISAQAYLQRFYESIGFKQTSEPYLEDGIPHIQMEYRVGALRAT